MRLGMGADRHTASADKLDDLFASSDRLIARADRRLRESERLLLTARALLAGRARPGARTAETRARPSRRA
jgi:hypothetical protein